MTVFDARGYLAQHHARFCAIRQTFHSLPEIAFEEYRTAAQIAQHLTGLGLRIETGLGETGILATLERGTGPTVMLRADMDALPQVETGALPYTSTVNGKAHACGHDGHIALLLATAELLVADPATRGRVHFLFQPAEEIGQGARAVVVDGLWDRISPDRVFGFHNWPELPEGVVACRAGPLMAASQRMEITLTGRGGHAALPHKASDMFGAVAAVLAALPSRIAATQPAGPKHAFAFTRIAGGHADNIIPDQITLTASFRYLDRAQLRAATAALEATLKEVGATFGINADAKLTELFPPLHNHPTAVAELERACRRLPVLTYETAAVPSMVSEDFGVFLDHAPGCYFWIGAGPNAPALHASAFDFNDALLLNVPALLADLVKNTAQPRANLEPQA